MTSDKELKSLEFDKILKILSGYVFSRPAADLVLNIKPENTLEKAQDLLEKTIQADRVAYEYCCTPSFSVDDISEYVKALRKDATLGCKALLQIARVLNCAKNFKLSLSKIPEGECPLIEEYAANMFTDSEAERRIAESVMNETELYDGASAKLREIRSAIRRTNDKIKQKLNGYISGAYSKYLQDNIVTMRGDRYVIPVKSECQGQIPGLVHDRSSTGATVFIEPFAVVELNNELRELLIDEQNEIAIILQSLSFMLAQIVDGIERSFNLITEVDVIFAKARYAREIKAVAPILNGDGIIEIRKGRHPLIDPEKVVPVDVRLGEDFKVLLITGPNTGGKTVTLKLVGLLSLMACSGIFVPCEENSRLAVFDGVYCDIGDEQSIEQSLSTFSSHTVNLIRITDQADYNSLVLLDELGAGTDPAEGSALAIAVIEYLLSRNCRCITTTHYNELKEYSYRAEGVSNASMDFDPETFAPVYRLLIGVSGSSNAIKIASKLGLPESITERATQLLSDEKVSFDSIIAAAESSRRQAEESKARAEELERNARAEYDKARELVRQAEEKNKKLDEKLAKKAQELLGDYMEEADEIIDQMREDLKRGDEQALFDARKRRKQLENVRVKKDEAEIEERYEKTGGEISVGDSVYVKKLKATAKVEKIDERKKRYTVSCGNLTTVVNFDDVSKIRITQEKKSLKRRVLPDTTEGCPHELNVIGQTVDEATFSVDSYLSRALLCGLKEVRIVHGKGSGALRAGLHAYFSRNPHIESFRLGKYGEGEDGVTVVTLK